MSERITVLDIDFDAFVREPSLLDWGHGEVSLFQSLVWWPRSMVWANHPSLDLGDILTPPHGPHLKHFWDRLAKVGWKFNDSTRGIAADSHATVASRLLATLNRQVSDIFIVDEVGEEPDFPPITIYHIDAHHDLGYHDEQVQERMAKGRLSCDAWLYLLPHYLGRRVEKIVVVYPEWRREPCPISKMNISEGYEELLQRRAEGLWKIGCELEVVYWNDLVVPEEAIDWITMAQSSAWVPPWYDCQFEKWMLDAPCRDRLSQNFGPERFGQFECRSDWPPTWESVKALFVQQEVSNG